MKKIIALSAILFAFAGCKKDGLEGNKPKISFKSVSSTDVPAESTLVSMRFRVQDGDGDIRYIYINDNRITGDTTSFDQRDIPDLQSHAGTNLDAELELLASDGSDDVFVRLREGLVNTRPNPDTMQLRIYIEDEKGNISDTIKVPKIAIHR